MKSTRFTTAAEGGLSGNNEGLKKGKNLWANFTISLVLSTSAAAIVFLGNCWLAVDETMLTAEVLGPLKTSELASVYNGKEGRGNSGSLSKGASLLDFTGRCR